MLGQSGYIAMIGAGVAKRLTFLAAEACGMSRRDADLLSDELSITATTTIGTAISLVTIDPLGASLTVAYVSLLENDLEKKRQG